MTDAVRSQQASRLSYLVERLSPSVLGARMGANPATTHSGAHKSIPFASDFIG